MFYLKYNDAFSLIKVLSIVLELVDSEFTRVEFGSSKFNWCISIKLCNN